MHVICEQLNCSIKGKESMLSTSGETCNVSSSSAIIILLEQGDLIEMTYVYSYVHQCLQGIHSELYFLECLCRESRYCRIPERHAFLDILGPFVTCWRLHLISLLNTYAWILQCGQKSLLAWWYKLKKLYT